MIKILFVGDSTSPHYTKAFYNAAKQIEDINPDIYIAEKFWTSKSIIIRLERHYKAGLILNEINRELYKKCKNNKYDLVFFYGSSLTYVSTVKKIKRLGCKIFLYCNDDPFSDWYKPYAWKNYRNALKFCDKAYAFREPDLKKMLEYGAPNAEVLKAYYIADRTYYIPDEEIELAVPDVVYIGHYERDGRDEYIKVLTENGITVGLNHSWEKFEPDNDRIVRYDKDTAINYYNEILNKSKIAIVFLSSINNDTYTTRCFEIPAVKTLMVSPYTKEMAEMYREDYEVVFFRDKTDFLKKISYYLENESEAREIAERGYCRLMNSHNEVVDRIKQIVNDYDNLF